MPIHSNTDLPEMQGPLADFCGLSQVEPFSDPRRPLSRTEQARGEYRERCIPTPHIAYCTFAGDSMRQVDAVKVTGIMVDVDAAGWPVLQTRLSTAGDEKATKAILRAMAQDDVIDLLTELGFFKAAIQGAQSEGMPLPNRVLYTGHGCHLIYWLPESMGAAVGGESSWTLARMKRAWRHAFGKASGRDLWWLDNNAIDLGTRIGPKPGNKHRSAEKTIFTMVGQDSIDEKHWLRLFKSLDAATPTPAVKTTRLSCQPTDGTVQDGEGGYTRIAYKSSVHGPLEMDSAGDIADRQACLTEGCSTTSLRTHAPGEVLASALTCHRCQTHWFVGTVQDEPTEVLAILPVDISDKGHAIWPDTMPAKALLSTRTGTGKTYLMAREAQAWLAASPGNKVLALSPTKALAECMAERLGLTWGSADNKVDLESERGIACCFASLESKSRGATRSYAGRRDTGHTMVIVDEIEGALAQLRTLFKNSQRARKLSVILRSLLSSAGRVILADAHAGVATSTLLEQAGINDEVVEMVSDKHNYNFSYINKVEGEKGLSSHARHRAVIVERARAGKRLAVFCASRENALDLRAVVQDVLATDINWRGRDFSIKAVVGAKDNSEIPDLSQEALTADMLIYTTSMGSGVSFDTPDHYDEVHAMLGAADFVDVRTVEQAVHRIRKPVSPLLYISGTTPDPKGRTSTDDGWIPSPLSAAVHWVDEAERRWQAGETRIEALSNQGILLSNMREHDEGIQKLEGLQAAVLAGHFLAGAGGAVKALDQDHTFQLYTDSIDASSVRVLTTKAKAARDAREQGICERTAMAAIIEDEYLLRALRTRGSEASQEEVDRVRATRAATLYGSAYTGASAGDKAELVRYMEKQGEEHVKISAMAALHRGTEADKMRLASILATKRSRTTAITAGRSDARASLVASLLDYVDEGEPGENFTEEHVIDYLGNLDMETLNGAGLTVRIEGGELQDARRLLSRIAGFAGLGFNSKRGPKDEYGDRPRVYTFDTAKRSKMSSLSAHRVSSWRAQTRHFEPMFMGSNTVAAVGKARTVRQAVLDSE